MKTLKEATALTLVGEAERTGQEGQVQPLRDEEVARRLMRRALERAREEAERLFPPAPREGMERVRFGRD
ncbi:MAG: hypothetical protein ABDH20_02035 [Thermus sp.]